MTFSPSPMTFLRNFLPRAMVDPGGKEGSPLLADHSPKHPPVPSKTEGERGFHLEFGEEGAIIEKIPL